MKKLMFLLFVFSSLLVEAQIQPSKHKPQISVGGVQCIGATNKLNLSTGIDPVTGNTLLVGKIDPKWRLLNYPPLNGTGYSYPVNIPNAYVIEPFQANWNEVNGAGILSSIPNPSLSHNNLFNQPWKFRRNFCVCEDTEANLRGVMRADDEGSIFLYNEAGNELYKESTFSNAFSQDNPFNTKLFLKKGCYNLEFHLANTGGHATGFVVQANLISLNNSKSLSDNNQSCCKNQGFITVQKILETNNCNGKIDPSDKAGKNWTFKLKNSSGQVIKTQTTDANGELTFSGLTAGTYTIEEVAQGAWSPSPGNSHSQQVTIKNNSGTYLQFFNCVLKGNFCCPGDNLVVNGDFEQGNVGIFSDFVYSATNAIPGKYTIVTGAQAAGQSPSWINVQNPSSCKDNVGKFMAVNGQNGGCPLPTARRSSVVPEEKLIWKQTFSVNEYTGYKFCFKAKKFYQLGWDIEPTILIKFTLPGKTIDDKFVVTRTIGACNWHEYKKHLDLYGYGTTMTVELILVQCDHGDGNDLAIDDIALIKVPKCPSSSARFNLTTSVQNGYFNITATPTSSDPECKGNFWEICEIDPTTSNCISTTKVTNPSAWRTSPFNFNGYIGTNALSGSAPGEFKYGKLYKITRGVWGECKSWNQFSMIIGTPVGTQRVVQYTENEFKAKKQQILQSFRAN